jgi:hypothetical protein
MAMHDQNPLRLERARCREDVRQKRSAGEPVQDLRQRGVHALSLSCGEHDNSHLHGRDSSIRVSANSLKFHQKAM